MELIGNIVGLTLMGIVGYAFFILIFHLIFYDLIVDLGFQRKVKLPKSKKYKGKIEPIYKLMGSDEYGYEIDKYGFGYGESAWGYIFSLMLLSFVIFSSFQYSYKGTFKLCKDDKELEDLIEEGLNLKDTFEKEAEKTRKIKQKEKTHEEKMKEKIEGLNQEFTENFI